MSSGRALVAPTFLLATELRAIHAGGACLFGCLALQVLWAPWHGLMACCHLDFTLWQGPDPSRCLEAPNIIPCMSQPFELMPFACPAFICWVSVGKGRDIELRHQRNPDVVFDCLGPLTGGLQAAWRCCVALSSSSALSLTELCICIFRSYCLSN